MSQFTEYPQFFDFSTPASASEPVSIGKDSPDFITSEWLNDGGDLPSQPAQNSPDFITSEWLNESFLDWPCSSNTFASSTSQIETQSPTDPNPLPQIQTRQLFDSNQEHQYSSGNDLFSSSTSQSPTDPNPLPQIQTRQLFDSNQEHQYSSGNDLFSSVSSNNETFFFAQSLNLTPPRDPNDRDASSTGLGDSRTDLEHARADLEHARADFPSAGNDMESNTLFCSPFSSGTFQTFYYPSQTMQSEITFPSTMNAPVMLPSLFLEQGMMNFVTPPSPASTIPSSKSEGSSPTIALESSPSLESDKELGSVSMKPIDTIDPYQESQPERLLSASEKKRIREWARNLTCFNCKTSKTPLWRRTLDKKHSLCNACGLYFKQYKTPRPVGFKDKTPRGASLTLDEIPAYALKAKACRKVSKSRKSMELGGVSEIEMNQSRASHEPVKSFFKRESKDVGEVENDDSFVTLNWAQLQNLIHTSRSSASVQS